MEENNNQDVEQNTVSKPEKKKKKSGKGFGGWFGEHKAEFKKIVWPNRREVSKETVTVIIVSLLVGAIIFGMDTGLQYGYSSLVKAVPGNNTNATTDNSGAVEGDNGISIDGDNDKYDFEIVTGVDGATGEAGTNDTTAVQ